MANYNKSYNLYENYSINIIFTFLDEGLEEPDTFTPEMEVEFHDGDFNIEYVVFYDQDGKVLFKDPDYNE